MTENVEGILARLKRLTKEAGLSGIEESTSYGSLALKVGGKSFKTDETVVISIPIDHKEHLLTMAPDIYFQTNHYIGWPHLPVRIAAIGDDELKQRLIDAWTYRAPKKLISAYRG